MVRYAITCFLISLACFTPAEDFAWAPKAPGKAAAVANAGEVSVENDVLKAGLIEGSFKVLNKWSGTWQDMGKYMVRLVMRDGRTFNIEPTANRIGQRLAVKWEASRAVERRPGLAAMFYFTVPEAKISAYWRILLRDDSTYARVEVGLAATSRNADVKEIQFFNFEAPSPRVEGKTPGSPLVTDDFFFGVEHPMGTARVEKGTAICGIQRSLPIRATSTVIYSAIIGAVPRGQTRRAVLAYVESERAHPYRPFLHYNSWYDIGYFTPYKQAECLDRINTFGKELVEKRGARVDSFLFDDGWDNYESVWKFHSGFPLDFVPLKEAAAKYFAAPGVWLSPWGGYGEPRKKRLAYGKAHGMEVDAQGYALSGPKYYKRFHEVTTDFVTRQGINHFKFDGTGSPDKQTPGSQFASDFDAAIALISDLRDIRPDLFVNLTTGTWPSPFWLRFADSTWRGGSDHSFSGVGSNRQQWITYRDGDTFHGVVERGPLYPLNSLMLHGLIYAQHASKLNNDPGNDFRDEIRSYFGTGTQLQEMYITPSLLTSQNWDDLAEAAIWSRANADVLRDTHWVGGDPTKLEVYGWASWSSRKGILVLRNPSDKPQAFSVAIAGVLELPPGFAKSYVGRSPWKSGAGMSAVEFPVGESRVLDLKPFEVRILDLEAKR